MTNRRDFLARTVVVGLTSTGSVRSAETGGQATRVHASLDGPDPVFEKPMAIASATLAKTAPGGVVVAEVDDYMPGLYKGALTPSPPHADMNPKKAIIISWKDNPCRFVFSHEASYFPFLEMPNGSGAGNQFFVGNMDNAELFNVFGRKEKNSFVEIIQSGPERVWMRWTYLAVTKDDDRQPRYRGTEDYFAYPNGLILRRMSFASLMPDSIFGYGNQPGMVFGILPSKIPLKDCFVQDPSRGDYHVQSGLDLYSDIRHDIFFDDHGGARRTGDLSTMEALSNSPGCAFVTPFKDRLLFVALGAASGFHPQRNQYCDSALDPTFPSVYGGPHGYSLYDHWPVGWQNSQDHAASADSPYPKLFCGGILHFLVPKEKRLKSIFRDLEVLAKDMEHNHWMERHVFYSLIGSATDWNEVRRIGRSWLDKGAHCARPVSVAGLV